MVELNKVNRIWKALEKATIALFDLGPVRMSTMKIVDFVVDEAAKALAADGGPDDVRREEVVEAWLYQVLEQLAATRGVSPFPKAN